MAISAGGQNYTPEKTTQCHRSATIDFRRRGGIMRLDHGNLRNYVQGEKMRKYVFLLLATILLIAPVASACAKPARIQAGLGQEFTLYLGQTATIAGENLEIRFAEVISDSRCPQGVQCIWAGEASCLTYVTRTNTSSAPYKLVLVQSGASDSAEQSFDGHVVKFRLNPYPVAGTTTPKSEKRLAMTVTRVVGE